MHPNAFLRAYWQKSQRIAAWNLNELAYPA